MRVKVPHVCFSSTDEYVLRCDSCLNLHFVRNFCMKCAIRICFISMVCFRIVASFNFLCF